MHKSIIIGSALSFGVVLQAFGQAPAGYVSLDEVEIEQHVPAATTPVIGTKPATAASTPAAKPAATEVAVPAKPAQPVVAEKPTEPATAAKSEQPAATVAKEEPKDAAKVVQAPAEPAKPVFQAKLGASLRKTLETWARQAGWTEVAWKLPEDVDFTLGMDGTFDGDFMAATRSFVDALGCEAELRVLFNQKTKVALVEPV